MSFGDWHTYREKSPPTEIDLMIHRAWIRESERVTAQLREQANAEKAEKATEGKR